MFDSVISAVAVATAAITTFGTLVSLPVATSVQFNPDATYMYRWDHRISPEYGEYWITVPDYREYFSLKKDALPKADFIERQRKKSTWYFED